MRLSLSRQEVDLLLQSLKCEESRVEKPTDKFTRCLVGLREKLLVFRNQVWENKYREA